MGGYIWSHNLTSCDNISIANHSLHIDTSLKKDNRHSDTLIHWHSIGVNLKAPKNVSSRDEASDRGLKDLKLTRLDDIFKVEI